MKIQSAGTAKPKSNDSKTQLKDITNFQTNYITLHSAGYIKMKLVNSTSEAKPVNSTSELTHRFSAILRTNSPSES
jgi:hypothetical protein